MPLRAPRIAERVQEASARGAMIVSMRPRNIWSNRSAAPDRLLLMGMFRESNMRSQIE